MRASCSERETESVALNTTIWQTGFKVTLGTAVLTPAASSCSEGTLRVDATFENRGDQDTSFDAFLVEVGRQRL